MAQVTIQLGSQEVASAITRDAVDRLGIKVGDEIVVIIKATEVMLGTP